MSEDKCVVCLSDGFKSGTLEDGVCGQCRKLWPGAKTPEDRNKKKKPEVDSYEATVKELVTNEVNSLLESFGILHRCLGCGDLYFKRSPAQKKCRNCKEPNFLSVTTSKEGN